MVAELGLLGLLLALLAGLIFSVHIRQGGFYYDDWSQSSAALFHADGPLNLLLPTYINPGNRPLLLAYLSIAHDLLGLHQHAYVALTTVAALGPSLALFLVLRMVGLERLHSGVIAVLVLLFPYADATHLWFQASNSDVTITLYLLGVAMALKGLGHRGRASIGYHVGALGFYAASLMFYETAATAILATGILYWWYAGRRAALPRWAADITVTLWSSPGSVDTVDYAAIASV
jgi:hypothetical protein